MDIIKWFTQKRAKTANSAVDRKENKYKLSCSFCPPNKGCNTKYKKRGTKKPKHKDKR